MRIWRRKIYSRPAAVPYFDHHSPLARFRRQLFQLAFAFKAQFAMTLAAPRDPRKKIVSISLRGQCFCHWPINDKRGWRAFIRPAAAPGVGQAGRGLWPRPSSMAMCKAWNLLARRDAGSRAAERAAIYLRRSEPAYCTGRNRGQMASSRAWASPPAIPLFRAALFHAGSLVGQCAARVKGQKLVRGQFQPHKGAVCPIGVPGN